VILPDSILRHGGNRRSFPILFRATVAIGWSFPLLFRATVAIGWSFPLLFRATVA
jgi:hypothetical protein